MSVLAVRPMLFKEEAGATFENKALVGLQYLSYNYFMAKVSFTLVPLGLEELRGKTLTASDRFQYSSVRRKPVSVSRKRKKSLTLKSVMPMASQMWAGLTSLEKDAWTSAGLASSQIGFQLFLRDIAIRLQNDLDLPGTPSDIVQYKVGHIEIAGGATAVRIEQIHPLNYFIYRKISGTRDQYNPVAVTESFDLPLEISISWHTDLTSAGASPFAKFYALVLSHYQGRDIITPLEINFGLQDEWQRTTATLSSVLGAIKGYSVYIEANDVTGIIEFDNVRIYHSGQNWARDPRCDSVNSEFTKAYQQIPRHWAPEIMPSGAYFDSRYYLLV
jgi:hypothetical protein